jgi:hypothetical protein
MNSRSHRALSVIVGAAVGAGSSLLGRALAGPAFEPWLVLGAGYGALFALIAYPRVTSPGSGPVWALGCSFLLWLAVPVGLLPLPRGAGGMGMLEVARARFPALVSYVLGFTAIGLGLGTWAIARPDPARVRFSWGRALVVGGLAGVVGGWAFGKWMAQAGFFPLIAGLVGSQSRMVGVTLHFVFALLIGASPGVLFQRGLRGLGSSMGWGMAYGILWWFLGPLFILPLWAGTAVSFPLLPGRLAADTGVANIQICNSNGIPTPTSRNLTCVAEKISAIAIAKRVMIKITGIAKSTFAVSGTR